jgi:hypothetical protein
VRVESMDYASLAMNVPPTCQKSQSLRTQISPATEVAISSLLRHPPHVFGSGPRPSLDLPQDFLTVLAINLCELYLTHVVRHPHRIQGDRVVLAHERIDLRER